MHSLNMDAKMNTNTNTNPRLTKVQKKLLKKQNQAKKNFGDAFIPQAQFALLQAQQAAAKQAALFQRASQLVVPEDVRISVVLAQHPEWQDCLTSTVVRVDKQHPHLLDRTIWYNALDKTHSFDIKHRIGKANYASITRMVNAGQDVSPLLRAYWFASREQSDGLGSFSVRNHFLDLWENTTEDVMYFGTEEMKRYSAMQKLRRVAMAKIGVSDMRSAQEQDDDSDDDDGDIAMGNGKDDTAVADLGEELATLSSGPATASLLDNEALSAQMEKCTEDGERDSLRINYAIRLLNDAHDELMRYLAANPVADLVMIAQISGEAMKAGKQVEFEIAMKSTMLG